MSAVSMAVKRNYFVKQLLYVYSIHAMPQFRAKQFSSNQKSVLRFVRFTGMKGSNNPCPTASMSSC